MRHRDLRLVPARPALPVLVGLLASTSACTLWQREPTFFADELTELVEQRSETIEQCYDRYVETTDAKAKGVVVVELEVEAKTGKLTQISVDPAQTTVPEPLAACVTDNIADLVLEPVDVNTGDATLTWEFALGARKKPPADPFANVQDGVLACYSKHLAETNREATGSVQIDYAFDREQGRIDRLELMPEGTTIAAPVADCAKAVLETAFIDPSQLEDRNAQGQRTFTFGFTPYAPEAS